MEKGNDGKEYEITGSERGKRKATKIGRIFALFFLIFVVLSLLTDFYNRDLARTFSVIAIVLMLSGMIVSTLVYFREKNKSLEAMKKNMTLFMI